MKPFLAFLLITSLKAGQIQSESSRNRIHPIEGDHNFYSSYLNRPARREVPIITTEIPEEVFPVTEIELISQIPPMELITPEISTLYLTFCALAFGFLGRRL